MKARHGLVAGKLYPPHLGHHLLVRAAAAASERVTVVVVAASVESIPLDRRLAWMREAHAGEPNVTVIGTIENHAVAGAGSAVEAAHVELVRAVAAHVTAAPVDAVFAGAPRGRGELLARGLGARHVVVDRTAAPISSALCRADPIAAWDVLAPAVRAFLARRVVVIGAESTGKTTLAAELADALRARGGAFGLTRWVPEHGRERTLEKVYVASARAALAGTPPPPVHALPWNEEDFVAVARRQRALEEAEARAGGPVRVCDTDAFATGTWRERYLGARSPAVDGLADPPPGRLYLLTHHDDVPFEDDGLRDGAEVRAWMTARFAERLAASGREVVALRGAREERRAQALAAIDAMLARGFGLRAPL